MEWFQHRVWKVVAMDHWPVALDGITVQHVGEALWESGTTAVVRSQCRTTYVRCLEDFTFALLFAESLTLSGIMPPVGEDTPGANLIRRPELNGIFETIDMGPPAALRDLFSKPDFRSRVVADIEAVGRLTGRGAKVFDQFFIREASSYLGDHPLLQETQPESSSYVFDSPGRTSHYVVDRELQELVSSTFTFKMIDAIQIGTGTGASRPALAEFVERVLVNHLANYWVFHRAVEGQPHANARLPHVTRAFVRDTADSPVDAEQPVGDTADRRLNEERNAWSRRQVYRDIVPFAMLEVLKSARSKDFFLEAARFLRDGRQFSAIRPYMAQLVASLDAGNRREADKLKREIRRKTGGSATPDSFALSVPVPFVGTLQVGREVIDALDWIRKPGRYYLRDLIQDSAHRGGGEYEQLLAEVFPDLFAPV